MSRTPIRSRRARRPVAIKRVAIGALIAGAAGLFGIPSRAAVPIERWQLPSGAQVNLVATDALPIVDAQIDFDAGSRRDPPAQAGRAAAMAEMISKGVQAAPCAPAEAPAPAAGAAAVPAAPAAGAAPTGSGAPSAGTACGPALDQNQLGEAWADLGAAFSIDAGADRLSFSLRSLSDAPLLDAAVALAAREIGAPAFPDAVWQRERERLSAALREADTRPATQAQRAFERAVYGAHPYGFDPTGATLAAIDTAALRAHHALLRPCRAKVTLVGALDRAQASRIATALLARLPAPDGEACPALPAVPEVQPLAKAVTERIPFDSAQVHVLIGQPGYARRDPDHFALMVGNHILGGGGFVSRLTQQVRERRGLAYSVGSGFQPGLHAGAFRIAFQTQPERADEAVQLAREVLARFMAEGPTEAELQAAKANLAGGFPLLIDSNRKLRGNVANMAWNDLPLDYLDRWRDAVRAVTVADIRAAFARKLQPDAMVTVVVGGKAR